MRLLPPAIVLCLVTCSLMAVPPAHGQEIPLGKAVLGYWYMGTMSGEDHDLVLSADGTLSLQNGGCFFQDPKIKSSWRQQGARITFDSAALRRQFGSYLRVVHYKGYVLLVPQRQEASLIASPGYSPRYCFWQNSMRAGGLQLPSIAYKALGAVDRHPAWPPFRRSGGIKPPGKCVPFV